MTGRKLCKLVSQFCCHLGRIWDSGLCQKATASSEKINVRVWKFVLAGLATYQYQTSTLCKLYEVEFNLISWNRQEKQELLFPWLTWVLDCSLHCEDALQSVHLMLKNLSSNTISWSDELMFGLVSRFGHCYGPCDLYGPLPNQDILWFYVLRAQLQILRAIEGIRGPCGWKWYIPDCHL